MNCKHIRLVPVLIILASLNLLASSLWPTRALTNPSTSPLILAKMANTPLKVGALSEIKGDKTCDGTGGIFVYAETKTYRIYICADRKDKTQPRYYRSRERYGKGKLDLEAKGYNPHQMRYFEFKNNGYSYLLQMPMSQIPAPELTVLSPEETPLLREKVTRYLARP